MTKISLYNILAAAAVALSAPLALAFEANQPPPEFPASHYETIWKKSPFTAAVDVPGGATKTEPDWGKQYSLLSYMRVGTRDVVTLMSKAGSQDRVQVTTDAPNEQQMTLVSVATDPDLDPRKVQIKVSKDGEVGTFSFESAATATPVQPQPPGMPGMPPGMQPPPMPGGPGMPVMPGQPGNRQWNNGQMPPGYSRPPGAGMPTNGWGGGGNRGRQRMVNRNMPIPTPAGMPGATGANGQPNFPAGFPAPPNLPQGYTPQAAPRTR